MKHRLALILFPLALSSLACTESAAQDATPDVTSITDTANSNATSPVNEDDVPSNVDDDPEIGAPKAPLGDCDVKADLEGISPNDWCSRELMTGAICEDGECVEPPGFGLPTDPPNNRPNPADRAQ